MFNHVMIGADDLQASKKFYDATLGALGQDAGKDDGKGRIWWRTPEGALAITKPIDGGRATGANGGTLGFKASSTEQVDAWHAAGLAAGGSTCEDPPGLRGALYLAYLRDPAGNKLCAIHR